MNVFVPEGAAVWHLSEDPSFRARSLIQFFEEMLAGIGYVPLGYLFVGAVRDQLKEDGADDLAEGVLNKRLVEALRSLLRKHNRPASLDACHDELVRAAATKVKAEPESPKR